MFEKAAAEIYPVLWICADLTTNKTHGQAFYVGPKVAITARHVIEKYKSIGVARWDGTWRGDVQLEDKERDIAVIVLADCVKAEKSDEQKPVFPVISDQIVRRGTSIGLMGRLRRVEAETGKSSSRTMFSAGYASFWPSRYKTPHWAIQGPFAEPGFSGGPAFNTSGQLVGVITATESMQSAGPLSAPWEFPVISELHPLRDAILGLIQKSS